MVSWYQANGQLVKTDILIWIEKLKRGLRGVKDFFTLGSDGTGATLDENIANKQSEIDELEQKLKVAQGKAQFGAKDTGIDFLNTLNKNAAKSAAKDVSSLTVELSLLQRQLEILETKKYAPSAEEVKARKQMYKDLADPLRLDPKYQDLYAALDKAQTSTAPDPASNAQATGLTDVEKKLAAENEAVAKATKERMAQMAAMVDLENELRAQSLSGLDQSLYKMEEKYDGYYEKLDDWVLSDYDNLENYETEKAKITDAKAAERAKIVATYQEKQRQEEAKTSQVQSEYAMAMAEATGDSLALQELQHQRFVENWVARGVSLSQAEELWQAQHVADTKSMLEKTLDAWTDTDKLIEQGTKQSVEAVYNSWEGFLNDITENGFDDLGDSALEAFHAIGDAWGQMAVQMFAQWTMSGMAGLLKDVLGFLGGGSLNFSNLLGNLFGKSGSSGGGIASSLATSIGGSAAWAGLKSGAASLAGALGLDSLATWITGAATQAATEAAVVTSSQVALTGVLGAEAASVLGPTVATEIATSAVSAQTALTGVLGQEAASVLGTTSTGVNAASGAGSLAGLSATLTPMGIALGVGSLGQLLSSMGFLMDGPRSAEEVMDRWTGGSEQSGGQAAWLESMAAQLNSGSTMTGVDGGFGFFSESAQEAYGIFKQLKDIVGLTDDQIKEFYDDLSPTAQRLLDSGKAAVECEDNIRGLAREIAVARDNMELSAETTAAYQDKIDSLAARYGLTGQAAKNFSNEIWKASDSMWTGAGAIIEYSDEIGDLADSVVNSAASIANTEAGINSITNCVGTLSDAMETLSEKSDKAANSTAGIKGTTLSGGGVKADVMHTGGRVAPLTRFHQGGPLLDDLPRFHSGYQLGGLGHDEVPIIGKVGEFMVRSERVTASTLPALQAFNLGAQAPASGPAVVVNGPLVQVEGPYAGSEAQLEDLARRLESKLRELDRSRWKA